MTKPESETTTYSYSTPEGYLTSVTGPVTGATTTYTYDSYGRPRTVTDADGYVVTTDYDALNRLVARTYPDGTHETFTYERLDLVEETDRLGRITRHFSIGRAGAPPPAIRRGAWYGRSGVGAGVCRRWSTRTIIGHAGRVMPLGAS
ncbi:MAG: hypothetical protein QM736_14170 [Vicinamibacterales bacterium]